MTARLVRSQSGERSGRAGVADRVLDVRVLEQHVLLPKSIDVC